MTPTNLRVALVILLLTYCATALAQNRFLPDDTNGIGIYVEGSTSESSGGLSGAFTFTANGRYDLGVGVEWVNYDADANSPELSSFSWGPHIAVALVRPEPQSPLGFEIFGSYASASFSGDELDRNSLSFSGDLLVLGGEIYFKSRTSGDVFFYPSMGLAYGKGTSELEGQNQPPQEATVEEPLVIVTVGMQIREWITVIPRFTTFDGHVTWSLAVGLVTPTN